MLMSIFNGMNALLHLFKFGKLFIMNIYIIDQIMQLCADRQYLVELYVMQTLMLYYQ